MCSRHNIPPAGYYTRVYETRSARLLCIIYTSWSKQCSVRWALFQMTLCELTMGSQPQLLVYNEVSCTASSVGDQKEVSFLVGRPG